MEIESALDALEWVMDAAKPGDANLGIATFVREAINLVVDPP